MSVEKPARELTTHQISFDIITRDFLKEAKIENHIYSINGVSFEVLVIPFGKCIPLDILPILEQMQKYGVKIIFLEAVPDTVVGAEVDFNKKSIIKHRNMLKKILVGCEVIPVKKLGCFLKEYQAVELTQKQPDLVVGEYLRNQKKYYMFFNENIGHPAHTMIKFKEAGYVYRYDAMKDILYKPERKDEGYELWLEPYESSIWIISQDELEYEKEEGFVEETLVKRTEGKDEKKWKRIELPEHWEVNFADSLKYPDWEKKVPLETPGLVSNLKGFEKVCGTVTFSCELEMDEWNQAILDVGEVFETAEVFVNGISAGVKICKPYCFNLSGLLKKGKNTLSIEVTNTLGTAIRDGLSQYLPIEPFGIDGKVKLDVLKE